MFGLNKKNNNQEADKTKQVSGNLSNKFQQLFKSNEKPKVSSEDFKNEKQDLNNFHENVNNEKLNRSEKKLVDENSELDSAPAGEGAKNGAEQTVKEKISPNKIVKKLTSSADRWRAPRLIKTNLIKGEVTTVMNWRSNIKYLTNGVIIAVLSVLLMYAGLFFWEKKAIRDGAKLTQGIAIIGKQLQKSEEAIKNIDVFQRKLEVSKILIDKHIYWTNFYEFLEQNILSDAKVLGGFSGDVKGSYNFELVVPSYEAIADQIRILRDNKIVKKVEISGGKEVTVTFSGADKEIKGISINLEIGLDPNIFYKSTEKLENNAK